MLICIFYINTQSSLAAVRLFTMWFLLAFLLLKSQLKGKAQAHGQEASASRNSLSSFFQKNAVWWIYCLCCHQCQTCLTKYSLHRAHRQQHRDEPPWEKKRWCDLRLEVNSPKCSFSWRCCLGEGKWALAWLGFAGSHPCPVPLSRPSVPCRVCACADELLEDAPVPCAVWHSAIRAI